MGTIVKDPTGVVFYALVEKYTEYSTFEDKVYFFRYIGNKRITVIYYSDAQLARVIVSRRA